MFTRFPFHDLYFPNFWFALTCVFNDQSFETYPLDDIEAKWPEYQDGIKQTENYEINLIIRQIENVSQIYYEIRAIGV